MARRIRSPKRTKLVVATYLVDRAYGGPEEGGWWYRRGELIAVDGTFFRDDSAKRFRDLIQSQLDRTENQDRPPIGSVCSIGVYEALIYKGRAPKGFPARRPGYE
jgi:hypothetical protein